MWRQIRMMRREFIMPSAGSIVQGRAGGEGTSRKKRGEIERR
jgi:hypothetical protein